MKEIKITSENYQDEVIKSDIPVLLDFWAEWCSPCQMIGPILSEIADEFDGKVKVGKINVDDETELAREYKVESIPMMYLIKNGENVDGMLGLNPKEKIIAMIEKHI